MKSLFTAAALVAASPAVFAADALPTREAFSCDSPGGRFDSYERTLSGSKVIMEATVRINEVRQDPRWWPVANIFFKTESSADYVGLSFIVPKGKSSVVAYARFPGQKDRFAKEIGSFEIKQTIPVKIELDGKMLTITVAGKELRGTGLSATPVIMQLSCSSVDAHIHGLRLADVR